MGNTQNRMSIQQFSQSPEDILLEGLKKKMKQCLKTIMQQIPTQKNLIDYFSYKKKMKRGKNFEGHWDGQKIIGIGLYHQKQNQDYYTGYLGKLSNGKVLGNGLQINVKINKQQKKYIELDFNQQEILYFKNWQANDLYGCLISKKMGNETIFIGQFNQKRQFLNGTYTKLNYGTLLRKYKGDFKHNKFHGKGLLQQPGQYRYKGQFKQGQKQNYGIEIDYQNKFTYIGQYHDNQKHGYGQVIYTREQKKIKLKGFWIDGIMTQQSGVFIDQNSQLIDKYQVKGGFI